MYRYLGAALAGAAGYLSIGYFLVSLAGGVEKLHPLVLYHLVLGALMGLAIQFIAGLVVGYLKELEIGKFASRVACGAALGVLFSFIEVGFTPEGIVAGIIVGIMTGFSVAFSNKLIDKFTQGEKDE